MFRGWSRHSRLGATVIIINSNPQIQYFDSKIKPQNSPIYKPCYVPGTGVYGERLASGYVQLNSSFVWTQPFFKFEKIKIKVDLVLVAITIKAEYID